VKIWPSIPFFIGEFPQQGDVVALQVSALAFAKAFPVVFGGNAHITVIGGFAVLIGQIGA
jgi:hypothetical protein